MRKVILCTVVIMSAIAQYAAAQTTITVGKKFEGVLNEPSVYTDNIDDYRNSISGFISELYVQLKGGEPLTVTAEVVGDKRQVALLVEDPSEKRTVFGGYNPDRNTVSVKALNTTGKYKITVISDKIGDFNVKVVSPNAPAGGMAGNTAPANNAEALQRLEEKLERLKAELEKAQEELKALRK